MIIITFTQAEGDYLEKENQTKKQTTPSVLWGRGRCTLGSWEELLTALWVSK